MDNVSIDIPAMMKAKDERVMGLTSGIEGLFKKNKVCFLMARFIQQVNYVKGKGQIVGPNEVKITLNEGGTKTIRAKNIVIATGSEVTPLPGVEVSRLLF